MDLPRLNPTVIWFAGEQLKSRFEARNPEMACEALRPDRTARFPPLKGSHRCHPRRKPPVKPRQETDILPTCTAIRYSRRSTPCVRLRRPRYITGSRDLRIRPRGPHRTPVAKRVGERVPDSKVFSATPKYRRLNGNRRLEVLRSQETVAHKEKTYRKDPADGAIRAFGSRTVGPTLPSARSRRRRSRTAPPAKPISASFKFLFLPLFEACCIKMPLLFVPVQGLISRPIPSHCSLPFFHSASCSPDASCSFLP